MYQDLTGKRFGRLVVKSCAGHNARNDIMWECECDCGGKAVVRAAHLRSGKTKSCGCLQKETVIRANLTHGLSSTRLYRIWQALKSRCYNPLNTDFDLYGGKGITVCDEWLHDFPAFYHWAMKNGYNDNMTIDRIDVSKGYCPQNCRWATPLMQSNNKSDNRIVFYHGDSGTMTNMCRKLNVNRSVIQARCRVKQCSFEEAVDNYQTSPFVEHWKNRRK